MARKESNEEQQFEAWVREAVVLGFVDDWDKQPQWDLIEGASVGGKFLHRPHRFTADFVLRMTDRGKVALAGVFQKSHIVEPPDGYIYVDTKGSFMNRGATQEFSINQKLMYERHGIWVAKVVPFVAEKKVTKTRKKAVPASGLFVDTWCPEVCRWHKRRKVATLTNKGEACLTASQFIAAPCAKATNLQP